MSTYAYAFICNNDIHTLQVKSCIWTFARRSGVILLRKT